MKTHTMSKTLLLLGFLMLSACATPQATLQATQEAPAVPFESIGLIKFQGEGYTFHYPAEARAEITSAVAPQTSVVTIYGPDVPQLVGEADWTAPGYTIVVRTYENSEGLDAEAWGRAYLVTLLDQILASGGPLSIPISSTGTINEDDVGMAVVAGLPAFWIEWFGGDHARMEYFVANGNQIVSFSFGDYPLANQPMNEVQQGIYSMIMGTLKLEGN